MGFFKKLKERLFKSSSKIDEGLDAIIEDGGEAEEIELEEGKNYYWKIITIDSMGNTSSSLGSFSTSA